MPLLFALTFWNGMPYHHVNDRINSGTNTSTSYKKLVNITVSWVVFELKSGRKSKLRRDLSEILQSWFICHAISLLSVFCFNIFDFGMFFIIILVAQSAVSHALPLLLKQHFTSLFALYVCIKRRFLHGRCGCDWLIYHLLFHGKYLFAHNLQNLDWYLTLTVVRVS